jgi:hypothetical protein
MSWDYAAVARQDVILVQYALSGGNFDEMICDIFKQINTGNSVFAYRDGDQTYFVLHDECGLNFIVVGSESPPLTEATTFLNRLRQTFIINPNFRLWKDIPPYGLQNEFSDEIHTLLRAEVDRSTRQNVESQEKVNEGFDDISLLRTVDRERENEVVNLRSVILWSKYRYLIIGCLLVFVILIIVFCAL